MKDLSSSGKVEHFSPLTRKLRSNSSKNLIFLSNGGKLPDKSVLKFKRGNTLPTMNLTPPSPSYPQSEPSPKIALNLGGAFQNHGTKSFPIFIIPPQEAPESNANERTKSLTAVKSRRHEDKKIKRKVKY